MFNNRTAYPTLACEDYNLVVHSSKAMPYCPSEGLSSVENGISENLFFVVFFPEKNYEKLPEKMVPILLNEVTRSCQPGGAPIFPYVSSSLGRKVLGKAGP